MSVAHRVVLGDAPAVWEGLGFAVSGGRCRVGGLELAFEGAGGGILRLEVDRAAGPPDGLPVVAGPPPGADVPDAHPNGASRVDHLVVATPSRDATAAELERAGGAVRRVGGPPALPAPMAFLRFGPLIVEVAESARVARPLLWGLAIAVDDLDLLRAVAGDRVGAVRPARQPGRRIATVRSGAGSAVAVAFMDGPARSGT